MSNIPEEWRPVAGFENYEVSNYGRVRKGQKEIRQTVSGRKNYEYASVQLWRDGKPAKRVIHKLVFETFVHPVPFGLQVDHVDYDRGNNFLGNLQCITYEENHERRRVKPATPRDPELEKWLDEIGLNI